MEVKKVVMALVDGIIDVIVVVLSFNNFSLFLSSLSKKISKHSLICIPLTCIVGQILA